MTGSAYGAGAPSYSSAELQRHQIQGRLDVAVSIRDRAVSDGDTRRAERWSQIIDELMDRLIEVRGK